MRFQSGRSGHKIGVISPADRRRRSLLAAGRSAAWLAPSGGRTDESSKGFHSPYPRCCAGLQYTIPALRKHVASYILVNSDININTHVNRSSERVPRGPHPPPRRNEPPTLIIKRAREMGAINQEGRARGRRANSGGRPRPRPAIQVLCSPEGRSLFTRLRSLGVRFLSLFSFFFSSRSSEVQGCAAEAPDRHSAPCSPSPSPPFAVRAPGGS